MQALVLIFRLFTTDGEFYTENALPPKATVSTCAQMAQQTVSMVADRFNADRVSWTCELRLLAQA